MITADIVGERARLTPDKTALVVVATGERLSYRDLDGRAGRSAALLAAHGVGKGDRVGILSGNRVEFLDAFCAAGKSGIILVPLGTRLTAHELAYIVRDAGPKACFYSGEFCETVRALQSATGVESWIAFDEVARLSDVPYGEAVAATVPDRTPASHLGPEDPYCLLYTSGTTGKPKGVVIPHRMVAWNGYNTVACWQLREDDVSPIFTPLYHAGGLGAFLVPIFTIGGTIVLHAGFDPAEVWRTIERERCTVVLGVPTIYKLLMEAPEFGAVDLTHVRWFASGGAPLPVYLIDAYRQRGVVLRQGYGLTEVGVNCFSMTDDPAKAGSIGKPLMFTEARLVDEAGGEVSPGEVGELLLRGPHVCRGYWNQEGATRAALDRDGWFHTGDLARHDEEHFFYIAGRKKDMIISGGVNVYPAEVEAELLQHPGVQDVALVGISDPVWGEVGVAFVVPRGEAEVDAARLTGFLATRLAKYKIPKDYVFVGSLPRTAYGKVVKGELRERYAGPTSKGHQS
jgi:fatty-acyl-CoA synthase